MERNTFKTVKAITMKTEDLNYSALKAKIPSEIIADYALLSEMTNDEATSRARELEKFLFICAQSEQSFVPSPAIDSIWHDFILHTRSYQQFCFQNFGRLVHHTPSRGGYSSGLKNRYIATIETLRGTFGDVDSKLWPHSEEYLNNQLCGSGGGDGSCDGDS